MSVLIPDSCGSNLGSARHEWGPLPVARPNRSFWSPASFQSQASLALIDPPWQCLLPAGPAQDNYALVAVADRVLVLWGKSTVTKRIKGGGCDGPRPANIGCDPVPDTVEWRVEPTGLIIGF